MKHVVITLLSGSLLSLFPVIWLVVFLWEFDHAQATRVANRAVFEPIDALWSI